jgi:homoserine dehydrogenase
MTMRILVAGFGPVGRALAIQLVDGSNRLRSAYGIDCRIAGIATSRDTWIPEAEGDPNEVRTALAEQPLRCLPGRHEPWDAERAIREIDADLLVEATSGSVETGEPAITNLRAALERGMRVVAASKGALVHHWAEIRDLAASRGHEVRVGAAAGAALPTVDVARYGLAGATIEAIDGILNGTSNYILSKMAESGTTFEEALRDAQTVGAAEADPRMDVEGIDTACKLVIIANSALGTDLRLDDVGVTGITGLDPWHLERSTARGHMIRLLGTLRRNRGGWRARVEPTPLRANHPLAAVGGFEKGICYSTDLMDRVTVIGGRSGPKGAAAALVRDIVNLGRAVSG